MLEFVKSVYRRFFEVFLWINLLVCTIGGGIVGSMIPDRYSGAFWNNSNIEGHPILGLIIGLIAGMFINIFLGGLIATFLNIDAILEQLRNNRYASASPQATISTSASRPIFGNKWQRNCKRCNREVDESFSACPYCGNNTFDSKRNVVPATVSA
ncbi:MAG: hypothetical protein LBH43_17900 [Treponema sp.]|jgi:hypothetical protein|nr:hypothetical protein [Treponema sp.]